VDEGGWVAGSFEYAPAPPRPEEQERSNDGWGYTPEEQAEADRRDAERAKEQPNHAGEKTTLPQLEELILERTRGRRGLSLPALTAASLSALVDRYGMGRVVEEAMGIIEPVDQPVMMLTRRLERVRDERPRAPNGNRW
jgi:hypothetical protein